MNSSRSRRLRLPVILLVNMLVFGIMFACCSPHPTPQSSSSISICAVDSARAKDFPNGACGSGAFVAQHGNATFQIMAEDSSGHPLANSQIHLSIHGANTSTTTVTTGSSGQAEFTYAGAHLGTDTITAGPASGVNRSKAHTAVIHWIPSGTTIHPIVWVHGVHEDATDFAHELNGVVDPDQAGDASEQTFSGLIGALTTTYSPSAMEAFCYVDDIAWTNTPSGCPLSETSHACTGVSDCISQGPVDDNAVELAVVISKLSQAFGNRPVTVIAYSMGGAIVRTLMAGCRNSLMTDQMSCQSAAALVNNVFLLNAAQEGSWLLNAKRGLNAATLSGEGIPAFSNSPFTTVLPLMESFFYAKIKDLLGLDLNAPAEFDLTPQSANINAHNAILPLGTAEFYSFYGDIKLGLQTNYLIYSTPPRTLLPLGDLVMLAQSDPATATPLWGGAALCDGCPTLGVGQNYHGSGRYHEWALTNSITIQMNGLVPLLSAPDAVSGLQAALNSPVQHLNISQPSSQDPGSPVQVHDITSLAGTATTDMSYEIYLIIIKGDGLE